MKSPAKKAMCIVVSAAAIAIVFVMSGLLSSSPAPNNESIEIIRDKYGIPHIFAETKAGGYYALGWTAAEDGAHVLYSEILETQGRSAEFIPPINEAHLAGMLAMDERAKALDYYGLAANWKEALPPDVAQSLTAFAKGFNDHVAMLESKGRLDSLYSSVLNIDFAEIIQTLGKVTERDIAATIINANTLEAFMNFSDFEQSIVGGGASFVGSNAAAIAGSLTSHGAAMLYGDIHNLWEGAQRIVTLQFPGAYFAGYAQGVLLHGGGSDKIAFADTRNNPDGSDIYKERLNPENPMQYRHKRQWASIKKKDISIKVKGGKPIEKTIYFTNNGWLQNYTPGKSAEAYALRIAVCDTSEDPDAPLKVITQRLSRPWSENIHELYQINKKPYVAFKSEVAADRLNNISYSYLGAIPVRAGDYNPLINYDSSVPVEGTNIWMGWTGKRWKLGDPKFQLPYVLNPRGGVVVSANNAPWYSSACDISGFARPAWIPNHVVPIGVDDTMRGMRLREILCSGEIDDFEQLRKNLAYDTLSIGSRNFMTAIKKGWKRHGDKVSRNVSDPNALKIHHLLDNWNFHADINESGMSAMFHFRRYTDLPWFRADYTPTYEDMETYVKDLKKTADKMMALYGTVEVPWGDIHIIIQGDKFIPLPGGTEQIPTLFQAYMDVYTYDSDLNVSRDSMYGDIETEDIPELKGKVVCTFGSMFIQGHILGEGRAVHAMVTPRGQISAEVFPGSPHLTQQAELMSQKNWVVLPRTKEEAMKIACPWGNNPNHEHSTTTRLSPKLN